MPKLSRNDIMQQLFTAANKKPDSPFREKIKSAFKEVTLALHPDKNLNDPNANANFQEFGKLQKEINELLNQKNFEQLDQLKQALSTDNANAPQPTSPPPSPEWLEKARAQNEENMRKAAEWVEQMKPVLKAQMEKFGEHVENFDLKPDPRDLETKLKALAGGAEGEEMNRELGTGQRFLFTYPKYDPNDPEIINKKPGYAAIDMTGTEPCVRFDPNDKASMVAALIAFKNTIGQDRDDVKIDRATLYADGEEKGKEREANLQEAIKKVNEMGINLNLNLTGSPTPSPLTIEPAKADGNPVTATGEPPAKSTATATHPTA